MGSILNGLIVVGKCRISRAFTLIELLVVIAVIGVLAALSFPVIMIAKDRAKRTTCLNNLRQINLGVRLYSEDSSDTSPTVGATMVATNAATLYSGYKELMKNYVGLKGASSPRDKLFACPADTFYPSYASKTATPPWYYVRESLHDQPILDYSSYAFNGGDNSLRMVGEVAVTRPGLNGIRLSSVKHPARTVLVMEASALVPWSWHQPMRKEDALPCNDAKNMVSFVDGHVNFIKIYWNSARYPGGGSSLALSYDPPDSYEYQWSAK